MAEGARLESELGVTTYEGSNPSLSALPFSRKLITIRRSRMSFLFKVQTKYLSIASKKKFKVQLSFAGASFVVVEALDEKEAQKTVERDMNKHLMEAIKTGDLEGSVFDVLDESGTSSRFK